MSGVQIIRADARHLPLADESIQCIVTSPPYWGLRKYSGEQELDWGDWRGAFGLEPTIEMYVAHALIIMREMWRVLRKDGVAFWNIGDSYAGNRGNVESKPGADNKNLLSTPPTGKRSFYGDKNPSAPKPKDLCLIPERIALAAQADGWWVRSRILWCKPNPMPESVTDRPTDAAEHIWMFTKSSKYFWDAVAVREKTTGNAHHPGYGGGGPKAQARADEGTFENWRESTPERFSERNLRNVWTFPTQPYPEAHFATFPEELPRRCIKAATSQRGACVECGTPWERITESETHFEGGTGKAMERDPASWHSSKFDKGKTAEHQSLRMQLRSGKNAEDGGAYQDQTESGGYDIRMGPVVQTRTIGWEPGCKCKTRETRPCIVLDPFGGSGTVGRVATELNRDAILVDLHYQDLQERRTKNVQRNLVGA